MLFTESKSVLFPMKMKLVSIILALAFGLGAFVGCASTSADQQKVIAKLAVSFAVLKVADKSPEKAARIVAIAQEVKALAGSDGANTVDLLMSLVRAKVAAQKLDAADQLLAGALVDMVGTELKTRLGSGVLTSDKLLVVGEVAGWIVDAAAGVTVTK